MIIFKIAESTQMEFPFAIDMAPSSRMPRDYSEESEEPEESISVLQTLKDNDGFISKFVLHAIIKQNKLRTRVFPGLIEVFETTKILLKDYGENEYQLIEDPCAWIFQVNDADALKIIQIREEDIY